MSYIAYLHNPTLSLPQSALGGKANQLAQVQRLNLSVPAGLVLLPQAFWDSLPQGSHSQTWPDRLHPTVQTELATALSELCPSGALVAVRSSALEEDGLFQSFAGQLDSFLDVASDQVAEKVLAVWRSAFQPRLLQYRQEQGLTSPPQPPAVLIQRMVRAKMAGVAFSADPVTGERGITIVSAVRGTAAALMAGEQMGEMIRLDRQGTILHRQWLEPQPLLTDEQVKTIAHLAHRIDHHFGRPQDIEWAIGPLDGDVEVSSLSSSALYLLQARPITTLADKPDPAGILTIWDNSNIAESYSGVTTPLTFSFARRAYEAVYHQFCLLMGVPKVTIAQHQSTFSRMIGLIQGRIYYNLLSWYRVLALLPGFTLNRRFMEQMMGVRESLPESIIQELKAATWQTKLTDLGRLCTTLLGLVRNYWQLPQSIRRFYCRLEQALTQTTLPLAALRADELATYYRQIEAQLLTRWDAPLVNDFFAMIFYGLLRRLAEIWLADRDGTLQNALISQEGGVISTEPARWIQELATIVQTHHPTELPELGLGDLLCQGTLPEIQAAIIQYPAFQAKYEAYLQTFGDRCLDELKLESQTLIDNPLPLLRAIGQLARQKEAVPRKPEDDARLRAEQQTSQKLCFRPLRRLLFQWVLRNARQRVRDRENLRFQRTRVFGRARQVFLELGKRFYALNLLTIPQDVFYLTVEEVLGFVEGTSTCTNLKGLVALRQAEFDRYRAQPSSDDRFTTLGIIYHAKLFQSPRVDSAVGSCNQDNFLKGTGCSPGIAQGTVRIVQDPHHFLAEITTRPREQGLILVAERTDPGWILLFPFAAGLIVERGSVLSHVAIVARELGIPAIVALPQATQLLKDGETISLDGSTGQVFIHS